MDLSVVESDLVSCKPNSTHWVLFNKVIKSSIVSMIETKISNKEIIDPSLRKWILMSNVDKIIDSNNTIYDHLKFTVIPRHKLNKF